MYGILLLLNRWPWHTGHFCPVHTVTITWR